MAGSERVTAGLPALSPALRSQREAFERTRFMNRMNLRDKISREEHCTSPDGAVDTTNAEQQLGRPLTCKEITKRLKRCNQNFVFERSKADGTKMGIYIVETRPDAVTGFVSTQRRFVCGMEFGISPEFSIRHYEDEKIPDPEVEGHWRIIKHFKKETRGWRTVLMRLMKERLITEAQVNQHFETAAGRDSRNWQLLTT